MSLATKIRLGVLAQANKLADAFVNLDDIGAVKQQVRDLEGNLDELRNAAATAEGYIRTVTRERDSLQAQATSLGQNIDFLLTDNDPSNDESATAFQVRLDTLNQQIADKNDDIRVSTETSSKLNSAVAILEAKHQQAVAQISRLESLDRAARAQAGAVDSAEAAEKMMSAAGDISVDNIAADIQRRADVASVKFEHAFEGIQDQTSKDAAFTQASMNVARRKAELAAKAAEHVQAAGGSAPDSTSASS